MTKEKGFITFTPGVDVPAGKQLGLQAERNQRLEQKILPLSLNFSFNIDILKTINIFAANSFHKLVILSPIEIGQLLPIQPYKLVLILSLDILILSKRAYLCGLAKWQVDKVTQRQFFIVSGNF